MVTSSSPGGAPTGPFPCLSQPWGCSRTTAAPCAPNDMPKVTHPWLLIGFAHANYDHFCLN